MQFYTVHEPPEPPADRIDRAASLVFIGDQFTRQAVVLGPLWLLANKLWHAFAAYVAALALVAVVILAADLNLRWISLFIGAFNLFIGFEGASLRRWALERKGWQTLGTVSGRTLDECERRFLEDWLPGQRISREQEFISTVSTLRGGGFAGVAPAAAAAASTTGGAKRGWFSWRSAR
jgi:hypothetical protein